MLFGCFFLVFLSRTALNCCAVVVNVYSSEVGDTGYIWLFSTLLAECSRVGYARSAHHSSFETHPQNRFSLISTLEGMT